VSTLVLTRRAGLVALGALALQGCASTAPTVATSSLRIRDIDVQVRQDVGDQIAAWVQQDLPGAIAQALGPYYAPGDRDGATLVARIDYIYLGPSSGGAGPAGSSQDTMKGVLMIRGARGGVAEGVPLRAISFYYPMAVDQALVERAYHGRVTALSQAFAGWVPGKLGLG
jgi:hypothetical protein